MPISWNKDFVAEFERFIDFEDWSNGRYGRDELKKIWEEVTGLDSASIVQELNETTNDPIRDEGQDTNLAE